MLPLPDHGDVVTAIEALRRVLAAITAGELVCSAAYRNRLEGAVVALESLPGVSAAPDTPQPPGPAG